MRGETLSEKSMSRSAATFKTDHPRPDSLLKRTANGMPLSPA